MTNSPKSLHSSGVHHRISYLGSVAVQQVPAEIGLTNLKTGTPGHP